jgi:hypothetical protein
LTVTVFLVLLAGHLLGDWVTQSDWQAANKTRGTVAAAVIESGAGRLPP